MFKPEEIIFAPTGSCNLSCAHCRVTRTPGPLSAAAAEALLRSARGRGIDLVGFSGGEPFLAPDFLVSVSEAAVEQDFMFDRLMTNGVWWRGEAELRHVLERLRDAGFDGTFGVSFDSYHGQDPAALAVFIGAVFDLWGRRDCCQIVWATSADDAPLFRRFGALAEALGGELILEDGLPAEIVDPPAAAADGDAEYDDPDALSILFERIPYSPPAETLSWTDGEWFADDLCRGPGNVLYVHPDGRIAACCGFGNENDQLILGKLGTDDFDSLLRNAAANPYIGVCYSSGLGAERVSLESSGVAFPGKIRDQCAFCDFLCKNGYARR